jgi:FMN phosphatase YigB (HAD superfamily)
MEKIRAILSDGGNILFSDSGMKKGPYKYLQKFMPKYLPTITFEEFEDKFHKYKARAQTFLDYDNNDALKDYLKSIGFPHILELVKLNEKNEKSEKIITLFEGVKETLERINEKNIKFIILTDSTKQGRELWPFLEKTGIARYVTDIISSKDLGVRKPDERFLNEPLKRHQLVKEEVIFLGHDYDELKGAWDQGFKVYALNYNKCDNLNFLIKENKLEKFADLERLIE